MSKRANRQSVLERKKAVEQGKRRIYLIVCEGETEKRYFDSMRGHPGVRLHAVHVRQAKHPQRERVIRTAREAERSNYTEIWAVFDTDGNDVAELCAKARRDSIETAPSNPTFETWLLLHLTDQRAALMSGSKAEKALKALLPNWSKGRARFEDFAQGLQDALERAERLPSGSDPSTGVYRLVRTILRG